ncbi:hypothetical protein K8R03_04705, partial [Candidatus Kaiserbacteria bacterium]|nr:hypothetical protein [Candidatus Kaiserbacteria bacterium]
MIKTTLTWLVVAMVAALLILFFINGGGFSAIVRTAQSFPTLKDFILGAASSSSGFQLPGQGDVFNNLGVDVVIDATDTPADTGQTYAAPAPSEIRQESSSAVYADTSPYAGRVSLDATNAYGEDAASEYV